MKRPWHIAAAFGASLLLLLAATAWMSWTTLRLDRAEAIARAQAAIEENIRLALWRMDSTLTPIISQERAQPYFAYSAFYPAEAAYARMFSDLELGEVLIPSPLLTPPSPYVLLHFQFDQSGGATSPQVPVGRLRQLASPAYVTTGQVALAEERLATLHARVTFGTLLAALPPPAEVGPPIAPRPIVAQVPQTAQQTEQTDEPRQVQSRRNSAEYQARSQQFQQAVPQQFVGNALVRPTAAVREGVFEPRWVDGELLLARRVAVNGTEYVQGVWLDWGSLRKWLLDSVADLLHEADLQPAPVGDEATHQRLLAGLPVQLVAQMPATSAAGARPEFWLPLLVAWGCVALAAVAVGALLTGTVTLSERRAAFVSAVTHELRTPLTTFRLYSEMLSTGMVTDDAVRARYLETLNNEAVRLSHLVENVLAYARLERRRVPAPCTPISVADLLRRVTTRLRERAARADMQLKVENGATDHGLLADSAAVEQILFNLLDNACKYAATAQDRRIHLSVEAGGDAVWLRVRDHGPGIARSKRRQLFTPFHKSATEAADTALGVGLGLALSRRLARAMGGELTFEPACEGACFVLRLQGAPA